MNYKFSSGLSTCKVGYGECFDSCIWWKNMRISLDSCTGYFWARFCKAFGNLLGTFSEHTYSPLNVNAVGLPKQRNQNHASIFLSDILYRVFQHVHLSNIAIWLIVFQHVHFIPLCLVLIFSCLFLNITNWLDFKYQAPLSCYMSSI